MSPEAIKYTVIVNVSTDRVKRNGIEADDRNEKPTVEYTGGSLPLLEEMRGFAQTISPDSENQ